MVRGQRRRVGGARPRRCSAPRCSRSARTGCSRPLAGAGAGLVAGLIALATWSCSRGSPARRTSTCSSAGFIALGMAAFTRALEPGRERMTLLGWLLIGCADPREGAARAARSPRRSWSPRSSCAAPARSSTGYLVGGLLLAVLPSLVWLGWAYVHLNGVKDGAGLEYVRALFLRPDRGPRRRSAPRARAALALLPPADAARVPAVLPDRAPRVRRPACGSRSARGAAGFRRRRVLARAHARGAVGVPRQAAALHSCRSSRRSRCSAPPSSRSGARGALAFASGWAALRRLRRSSSRAARSSRPGVDDWIVHRGPQVRRGEDRRCAHRRPRRRRRPRPARVEARPRRGRGDRAATGRRSSTGPRSAAARCSCGIAALVALRDRADRARARGEPRRASRGRRRPSRCSPGSRAGSCFRTSIRSSRGGPRPRRRGPRRRPRGPTGTLAFLSHIDEAFPFYAGRPVPELVGQKPKAPEDQARARELAADVPRREAAPCSSRGGATSRTSGSSDSPRAASRGRCAPAGSSSSSCEGRAEPSGSCRSSSRFSTRRRTCGPSSRS